MKAISKGLMTIAMLAATAACDGAPTASNEFVATPAEPSFARSSAQLTFSSAQSYSEETPATATGGTGSISFTGSITTPTPCYAVNAAQTTRKNEVTVTVTAASTGGICTQIITNNNYQGAVTGLTAGTYTFTVINEVGGTRTVAQTSTVVVQ
ncbi:hypothetical protein [Longimicrobium sp.]|uniref:hypothetical protein n=1 Tax=Longimicrobium sp. TaxID=2029185 RepID=UPI002E31461D|nr:hypothetical protein [Longimicrobium sp.]HEX6039701.1 hypothetical protein [Longimicrobium sp.]